MFLLLIPSAWLASASVACQAEPANRRADLFKAKVVIGREGKLFFSLGRRSKNKSKHENYSGVQVGLLLSRREGRTFSGVGWSSLVAMGLKNRPPLFLFGQSTTRSQATQR